MSTMSMWQVTIGDGVHDKEHHHYDAIAWQQLLNNLDLTSESDSTSEDGVDAAPKSCPTPTIQLKQSNASAKDVTQWVKLDAHRTSSSRESPLGLPEDECSSEDEHKPPGDRIASGRSMKAVYSSPSTTFTTKSGSGDCAVPTQNSSGATAPCFFVNGARHSIEAPRKTPDWTAALSSSPSPAKRVSTESTRCASVPVDHFPTPAKTVVAGNASSRRSERVRTTKSAKQSKSSMNPPPYPMPGTPATGYGAPASPPSSGVRREVQSPFTLPNASSAYLANTAPAMQRFQGSAMPTAQQASISPLFWSNNGSTANAFSNSPLLSLVLMDGEGRLHLASQGQTPSASAPPALPMVHVPGRATAPSGMPQVHYTPSTVQAEPWRPVAAPSTPLPCTRSSGLWGNTKAWVFRDNRWIALSM
ncbi:hypothetical protein GH5_01495 [Leishmania sp. Ghana 2012 LV757]|uniref:hypothetical protein n=1 Tax=Leishmania sp. Ghana 2012 LV757 TaxID=2803181 RepID=UPI001B60EE35|nr:hypothetical protein GH5_01495 [Leishmania sp. Ghana 2012 LV757]